MVCAVTDLTGTHSGQWLRAVTDGEKPSLTPVLSYRVDINMSDLVIYESDLCIVTKVGEVYTEDKSPCGRKTGRAGGDL